MIRFATFGTHKLTQEQMLGAQSRLFETQMQISSVKVSRNYAGIAIESRRLVNLENAVTEVNGFIKNIDVTESRLQLMENAVSGTFDVASLFRNLLVNALNIDNASLLTLRQRAEDMLQELTGALNIKQDNRFLFSGSRIDSPRSTYPSCSPRTCHWSMPPSSPVRPRPSAPGSPGLPAFRASGSIPALRATPSRSHSTAEAIPSRSPT